MSKQDARKRQRTSDDKAARSAEAWCCKICQAPDGKPFRNFGDRRACHKCGLAKGSSFLRKADETPKRPPSSNMAERQAKQRLQSKDSEIARLRKELEAFRRGPALPTSVPTESLHEPASQSQGCMDLLKKQLGFQEECLRAAKNAGLEEDTLAAEVRVAKLRESIDKARPPATQHELAHKRLKKARRELEELQGGAAKAREIQAAASAAVADVEAAVQTKELQIVELEAAFTETARAALPSAVPAQAACSFTIAEEELANRPELSEFCRDARFAQAMDILCAKASRPAQETAGLAASQPNYSAVTASR